MVNDTPKGWHRHKNGNGLVQDTATVEDGCFVGEDACVYGNARVYGNAWVYGDAQVYGDARVSGDALVYGNARVSCNAWVYGDAQVYGDARVSGDALVYGNARVSCNAWVYGDAQVYGKIILISGLQWELNTSGIDKKGNKLYSIGCMQGTFSYHTKRYNDPAYNGSCNKESREQILSALRLLKKLRGEN